MQPTDVLLSKQLRSLSAMRRALPVITGLVTGFAIGAAAQSSPGLRLVTPEGHTSSVQSAVFSPDGKYLVSAGSDHTALVWEVASGRGIERLAGHTHVVNSAAFSPDGRQVVTASGDGTARVWELASGREILRLSGHTAAVWSARFSPDGRFVVTASGDSTARIWEAVSGHEVQRLSGHTAAIFSAMFSPDGAQVLTASEDGTARIWSVTTGHEVQRFPEAGLHSAAYSPDGRAIVTASGDGTARIWEVTSGRERQRLSGHSLDVVSAGFSPDGRLVVTGSGDHTARVWDVASGREVQRLAEPGIHFAAFSPDGREVVTAGEDGTDRIWEVASGKEIQRFTGHTTQVLAAAFSSDGQYLVTASWDRTARIWELASGREVQRFTGHTSQVWSAAFSPDAHTVVTASGDGTVRIWDVATAHEVARFSGHSGPVWSAAFSPDGRLVLTAGADGTSRIWEVASGRELRRLTGVRTAAFSSDGREVITAGDSGTARIWDLATGRATQRFTMGTGQMVYAALSPDGRQVVTAGDDRTAYLWDVATGREVRRFTGHAADVWFAAFSPDGSQVVTASGDGTARIWDVGSGRELRSFSGHSDGVLTSAFSPDGRRMVTGSRDGSVRVWNAGTGEELFRRLLVDSTDWVVVAPDGRFDGTEAGMRLMHYARGLQTVGLDAFFEKFYTPGLTGQIMAGTPYTGPDIRRGFGLAPSVRILSPAPGATVSEALTVAVAVKDEGGGAEDIRLYHNGALVAGTARGLGLTRDGCPRGAVCFQVALLPGSNTLEATAFSTARIEAERARVTVSVPGMRPTATLHLLVVGINRYQNPRYDLNYGRGDAKAFLDSLLNGGHEIFAQVSVDSLFDSAATGLAIKAAFRRVAVRAKPQDVFVFYYAGHGIAEQVGDSTRFYLVPTDVTQMSDAEQLAQRAVSNLRELLDAVPARKKLMLIDACQSGEALLAFAGRGAGEEQAIARLSRASGVFVISAAGSDQVASEVGTLGHGVFTYAWLRAMAGDSSAPRERLVGAIASEVERTMPELSRQYHAQPQYPIIFRNGQDFPIIVR